MAPAPVEELIVDTDVEAGRDEEVETAIQNFILNICSFRLSKMRLL